MIIISSSSSSSLSICEDFSVIRSLKLYAKLLPTQPDFSSFVEVRQPSHNTNRTAAA